MKKKLRYRYNTLSCVVVTTANVNCMSFILSFHYSYDICRLKFSKCVEFDLQKEKNNTVICDVAIFSKESLIELYFAWFSKQL